MYEDCGIQHYQAAHDIAKPLDQLKPADRNSVLTQICRKVRDAAAKPVASFKKERFDKNPLERARDSDSVLEDEVSKGAIRWEDHLGHTRQGEPPAIMCQAIQLSGTNISGKPIRIESARLVSKISDESVEVDIGTLDGWVRPEQMHSIRPDSKVTLRATFNAPKGLTAQQFIKSWGQCAFLIVYKGVNEEIPISEEMTRALYENFRPEVIAPRPIPASQVQGSRDAEGFYTELGIKQLVDESSAAGEKSEGAILIYQTQKQHTWLVATYRKLYCIVDDFNRRKSGKLIQWSMLLHEADPVKIRDSDTRNSGFLNIGHRKDWYYSKRLFPTDGALIEAIKHLILQGKLGRREEEMPLP